MVTVNDLNLCTLSIAEVTPLFEQCAVQQKMSSFHSIKANIIITCLESFPDLTMAAILAQLSDYGQRLSEKLKRIKRLEDNQGTYTATSLTVKGRARTANHRSCEETTSNQLQEHFSEVRSENKSLNSKIRRQE